MRALCLPSTSVSQFHLALQNIRWFCCHDRGCGHALVTLGSRWPHGRPWQRTPLPCALVPFAWWSYHTLDLLVPRLHRSSSPPTQSIPNTTSCFASHCLFSFPSHGSLATLSIAFTTGRSRPNLPPLWYAARAKHDRSTHRARHFVAFGGGVPHDGQIEAKKPS